MKGSSISSKIQMIRSVLVLLCLTFFAVTLNAQPHGLTSDGTDFYLGFVPSGIRCPAVRPFIHVYALITSYYDNNVRVNYFDASGVELQGRSYQVQGKHSIQVDLDQVAMRPTPDGEFAEYKACHILSLNPISVQYYSTGPASGAEYSVFPTPALGEHYIVAAHPSNTGAGAGGHRFGCDSTYLDSASSVFMIVAAHDSTHVTIIPNSTTYRLRRIGVSTGPGADGTQHPFNITLNRGQIYWVKSMNDLDSLDESGSTIDADKPVVVIAGNEDALVNILPPNQTNGGVPPSRNLVLQQMIPSEYLVAKDHLSMALDAKHPRLGDNTGGEFYKMYASSPTGATAIVQVDTLPTTTFDLTPFGSSTAVEHVVQGINISSRDDSPIMVEENDYRRQYTGASNAPTMMNVLAKSQWADHYAFMVPDDAAQVRKHRYINAIAKRAQFSKIKMQKNGGQPTPLDSLATFGQDALWASHPELIGKRFEMTPGSYFITGDSNFAVYTYGFLGLDPDIDLGDSDDDDYYYEYASPAGEQFFSSVPTSLKVTVIKDTCIGWTVSVTEHDSAQLGLASIDLLNDPSGLYSKPLHVSFNMTATRLDVSGKTDAVIAVRVLNPLRYAYAAIRILTRTGKDTIIELSLGAVRLSLSSDSFAFVSRVGIDTCSSFIVRNDSEESVTFTSAQLRSDSTLNISSIKPALPFTLSRGDSVRVNICYRPVDTLLSTDTVVLHSSCFDINVPVDGRGITPLIIARDMDFGYLQKNQTSCRPIQILNPGTTTLTIDTFTILGSAAFSVSNRSFPTIIHPGEAVYDTVCYHPTAFGTDTATIVWSTNLPGKFAHKIKDFSTVYGKAVTNSVTTNWVASELHISPNPIHGNVLSLQGDLLQHRCTFDIYDLLGVKVKSIEHSEGRGAENLNISQLAAGSYYLRVEAAGLIRTVKFIVDR